MMDRQVSAEQRVRDQAKNFQNKGMKLVDRFMQDYNRVADARLKQDREILNDLDTIYGESIQQIEDLSVPDTKTFMKQRQKEQKSLEKLIEEQIAAMSA